MGPLFLFFLAQYYLTSQCARDNPVNIESDSFHILFISMHPYVLIYEWEICWVG